MKLAEDLKKAVLQAAMQGKLTKQLESDSSVDELLKKIADEKAKLIAEGKIKKERGESLPLSPARQRSSATPSAGSNAARNTRLEQIPQEEIPFEIPENWRWTRLRNIVYSRGQKTPDKKFSYIDIGSINNQKQTLSENENIIDAKDAPCRARKIVAKNDVIYSTVRPYLHNMCIIDKDFSEEPIASTGFAVMTCIKVLPEFLLKYLLSPDFDAYANDHENSKGVTYPAINDNRLYKALIPIPPIEEQQRIVEKLNQLLPLIDEYGKEEDELIALCQKFPEEMKKSVLQSAMQGKLTKQLETDSSVNELLKKIADEKAKNNQVWKAKKQPPINEILETIDANEIPENWKWVKLSQIAHSYIGLTYSPSNVSSNGIIVLRSSNIQNGKMDYKDIVKVEMDIPENKMCKKGDILVCARNGSKSLVGKAAIIDADGMSFGAFMAIIKSPCNEFLYHYLSSPYFKKQMALDSSTVTVNQITQDMLFNACVPIPPIEEQQRIVEKLNTILPIIDSMTVYGTKKKAGRPKQEEALAFISSLLGTKKSTVSKPVTPEITELTSKAKVELPAVVKKYASLMGVTYNRITIRHQKTRWGSCTKTGNLSFNCLILKMPETVRDYVIVHELAHRKELNHSTKFWTIVAEYCPWYKEAKLWLKDNGQSLMELKLEE